jgi:hypothetical protein
VFPSWTRQRHVQQPQGRFYARLKRCLVEPVTSRRLNQSMHGDAARLGASYLSKP